MFDAWREMNDRTADLPGGMIARMHTDSSLVAARLACLVCLVCLVCCSPQSRVVAASTASPAPAGLAAFPGAQGFGARASGGRGGDVYHVSTLADAGPGSLRFGVESASGPRTIVFDVSGAIALASPLRIERSNLTIAGQTAPPGGITLRDEGIVLRGAHDIVLRYLRVRRGDLHVREAGRPKNSAGLDDISIAGSKDVIVDHVSLSWSCDEVFGIVRNQNVTVQWSLIAEPLGDPALHPYGDNHAYGLNISASSLSLHHNLIARYVMRGPQFEPNDALDAQGYDVAMEAVNNLSFDYKRSGARYKTGIEDNPEAATRIRFGFHFVNNSYVREPGLKAPDIMAVTKHGVSSQVRVYVAGNIGPDRPRDDLDPWLSVSVEKEGNIRAAGPEIQAQMSDQPLFAAELPVSVDAANELGELLTAGAGVAPRDAVDRRLLQDVRQTVFRETLRSQAEVGGWPEAAAASRPADWDSDRDGMPDAWERARGLNAADPSDRNADDDGDQYTNLEEYLSAAAGS